MTEEERISIVNKIDKEIKDKENLKNLEKYLKDLENIPVVMEYINTKRSIELTERDLNKYRDVTGKLNDSLNKRITQNFQNAHCSCNHNLYIYYGSLYFHFLDSDENLLRTFDNSKQNDDNYVYHSSDYVCIECGEIVHANSEELFESSHNVLRINSIKEYEYYRKLYYYYLYAGYSTEEVDNIMFKMFYNHAIPKKKALKK